MSKRIDDYFSYASNDQFIWTNHDPDVELLEPPILCSLSRNHFKFGHLEQRPPVSHTFTIVNHGEYPVAFKIMTTDNFIYFVDQKYGIIPGRRLHRLPYIQSPNSVVIEVFRRPYGCIHNEHATPYFNIPKKDRLHILLTTAHSFSIPPAVYFNPATGYEKLKICLEFTAAAPDKADIDGKLYKRAPGWCTWNPKTGEPLHRVPENVKEAKISIGIPKPQPDNKRKKRGKWAAEARERLAVSLTDVQKFMRKSREKAKDNEKVRERGMSLERSAEMSLDRSADRRERSMEKSLERHEGDRKPSRVTKVSRKYPKDWHRPGGKSVWEAAKKSWEAPLRAKKKDVPAPAKSKAEAAPKPEKKANEMQSKDDTKIATQEFQAALEQKRPEGNMTEDDAVMKTQQ